MEPFCQCKIKLL